MEKTEAKTALEELTMIMLYLSGFKENDRFSDSDLLLSWKGYNFDVLNKLDELIDLGPLHMKANVGGVRAFMEVLPNTPMVAVFDTAFHQTMPKENYIYPVPREWYEKYGVRKYGFHGTSHKYITTKMKEKLGRDDVNLIICHIGSGASISAVKEGKCIDTSMGFTPNAGIMMGTRSGDIDASIIPYIMEVTGMSVKEVDNALNKNSGLLALSGVSSDSRDVEEGANNGDKRCILAENVYVRRVVEYIAKYYVLMGGADAICFTAGIGENSCTTRKKILEKLEVLGIKVDEEANGIRGEEKLISTKDSSVPCYVIPTNEELMIARDTYNLSMEN